MADALPELSLEAQIGNALSSMNDMTSPDRVAALHLASAHLGAMGEAVHNIYEIFSHALYTHLASPEGDPQGIVDYLESADVQGSYAPGSPELALIREYIVQAERIKELAGFC